MKREKKHPNNQDGFVLVAALLILLTLTLMGLAVNRNTQTEWRIAMNDRLHKETFYAADAATELAAEVLVQNIACFGFSGHESTGMVLPGGDPKNHVFIEGDAVGFWRFYAPDGVNVPTDGMDDGSNGGVAGDDIGDGYDCDDGSNGGVDGDGKGDNVGLKYSCPAGKKVLSRDMVFPAVFGDPTDVTTFDRDATYNSERSYAIIKIGGETKVKEGSALQMAAGYEGLGQGAAGGGTELRYDINVRQRDQFGSESVVCVKYAHVLGSGGACNY
jgi:hypothetical protein